MWIYMIMIGMIEHQSLERTIIIVETFFLMYIYKTFTVYALHDRKPVSWKRGHGFISWWWYFEVTIDMSFFCYRYQFLFSFLSLFYFILLIFLSHLSSHLPICLISSSYQARGSTVRDSTGMISMLFKMEGCNPVSTTNFSWWWIIY